jgi:tRNA pseudouridine38-40 synthase
MNTLLYLRFDGRDYHGWQIQKDRASICGTLKTAIEKTLGRAVTLHGCGRTDAGVHAETYAANFRGEHKIPLERLPHALNARLPRSVAVLSAFDVPDEFHAINSCTEKEYTYRLYTAPVRDPLLEGRAYHYPHPADLPLMRAAAGQFIGRNDFACVRTMGTPVKSTVRNLMAFDVAAEGDTISFAMRADGFLYNMARALVGTLLWVNEGKVSDIPALIAGKNRAAAGPVLPACGLYMTDVLYGELNSP